MKLSDDTLTTLKRWIGEKGPQGMLDHACHMSLPLGKAALYWLAENEDRPVTTDVLPVQVTQIVYKLIMLDGTEVRVMEEKRGSPPAGG